MRRPRSIGGHPIFYGGIEPALLLEIFALGADKVRLLEVVGQPNIKIATFTIKHPFSQKEENRFIIYLGGHILSADKLPENLPNQFDIYFEKAFVPGSVPYSRGFYKSFRKLAMNKLSDKGYAFVDKYADYVNTIIESNLGMEEMVLLVKPQRLREFEAQGYRFGHSDGALYKKQDPTRPLPGQAMADARTVAVELAKHDVNTFTALDENNAAVKLALQILIALGEGEKADKLEWMAKAGLIRAGPVEGFLATTAMVAGLETIILSSNYPAFNTVEEQALSLVHEIGAVSQFNLPHDNNIRREKCARRFLCECMQEKAGKDL